MNPWWPRLAAELGLQGGGEVASPAAYCSELDTLEHVAAQAQVSVGMVSLIETGERPPSLRSWERIRQTLGHQRAPARGGLRPQPREISDELVAALGACLAAERQASLASSPQRPVLPLPTYGLAPRRLAEQLEPTGMLGFLSAYTATAPAAEGADARGSKGRLGCTGWPHLLR